MSSRKGHSFDGGGGTNFGGRRLSSAESKEISDEGGGSEGGLCGSPQQRYSVPHFISRVYYRLGLLCASHPRSVLILTFIVIVWSCFPLLSLPIYSTRPQIQQQALKNFVREVKHGRHLSGALSPKQEDLSTPKQGTSFTIISKTCCITKRKNLSTFIN